jgi:hypothetical protein
MFTPAQRELLIEALDRLVDLLCSMMRQAGSKIGVVCFRLKLKLPMQWPAGMKSSR